MEDGVCDATTMDAGREEGAPLGVFPIPYVLLIIMTLSITLVVFPKLFLGQVFGKANQSPYWWCYFGPLSSSLLVFLQVHHLFSCQGVQSN